MNRWQLFSTLKGFREIEDNTISFINKMNERELKEGVIEYLLWKNKNHLTDDKEGVM